MQKQNQAWNNYQARNYYLEAQFYRHSNKIPVCSLVVTDEVERTEAKIEEIML